MFIIAKTRQCQTHKLSALMSFSFSSTKQMILPEDIDFFSIYRRIIFAFVQFFITFHSIYLVSDDGKF